MPTLKQLGIAVGAGAIAYIVVIILLNHVFGVNEGIAYFVATLALNAVGFPILLRLRRK